jgi:hypothetical protein
MNYFGIIVYEQNYKWSTRKKSKFSNESEQKYAGRIQFGLCSHTEKLTWAKQYYVCDIFATWPEKKSLFIKLTTPRYDTRRERAYSHTIEE